MRLWPGLEFCSKLIWSYTGVDQTQMHHNLFGPPSPNFRLIIDPCDTWAQCWTLSSPSLLCPWCPRPPKCEHIKSEKIYNMYTWQRKSSFWILTGFLTWSPTFPSASSGDLKMLFFTNPFLPNAFLLKFCHFPFSLSPWKRKGNSVWLFSWSANLLLNLCPLCLLFLLLSFQVFISGGSQLLLVLCWVLGKPALKCTFLDCWNESETEFTWAWTVVVPLEGSLSKPSVDTKIPLERCFKLNQKDFSHQHGWVSSTSWSSHLNPLNLTDTSPSALISSILASWYWPSTEYMAWQCSPTWF